MTSLQRGDFVEVQPDTPGGPTHFGVIDTVRTDGFVVVRVRGVPFLVKASRISRAD